ncbi:MAG TPA: fasciclin domain-containing protein [Rhodanobacteraceae bacterium]|nr:fasciclin domain-containing protein [Rhodanobacteraceae bacterium]
MKFPSRRGLAVGLSLALAAGTVPAFAQMSSGMDSMNNQHTVMVGGAAMYPSRNIVQNAMHSRDHTTLVKAVKAAGLVKTLEGPGPFTVFAPTNEAFAALPEGTVQNLLKPANKDGLRKILTYHVVPGRLDSEALDAKIAAGNGEARLKTVEGDWLTVKGSGTHLTVTDDKGNTADVTIPNVYQSNGVIMVINKVLMP